MKRISKFPVPKRSLNTQSGIEVQKEKEEGEGGKIQIKKPGMVTQDLVSQK